MRSLLVRQFPDDLLKQLHYEAIARGETVRSVVIRLLGEALTKKGIKR